MNAVLALATGSLLLATGPLLGRVIGFDEPGALTALAIGILAIGTAAFIVSSRRGLRRERILGFAFADGLWVFASMAVLVFAPHELTAVGRLVVGASAGIVSWFAMAQIRAARNL